MKRTKKLVSLLLATLLLTACIITAFTVNAATGDVVYCENSAGWGTVYCYMWNAPGGAGNENAAWPGVQMTKLDGNVWSYQQTGDWSNIIFNAGMNQAQTGDMTYPAGGNCYNNQSGAWTNYNSSGTQPTNPDTPTAPVVTSPQPTNPNNGGNNNGGNNGGNNSTVSGSLGGYFSTNPNSQVGVSKTISVDGSLSDWDSSMLVAQGTANDDPRVYRPNSMYEVGVDLYALYAAYDDNNLYLMWEMTNVQDVVAPNDDYPMSQGTLWQTQELPFFIAVDTGKSDAIGNNAALTTGGTIWNSGITFASSFNRLISINTKGGNGPWVYHGTSAGLNPVEVLAPGTSKITMDYGQGILSENVYGIDKAYGEYNNRVPGDVQDSSAAWVDFNQKGHNSAKYDFFYELSIPYSELGITKSDVQNNGIGVMLVATMGMSGMDCLPGDLAMTDNADLDDAANSQENNSFEKSDEDFISVPFASVGKMRSDVVVTPPTTQPDTQPDTVPDTTASQPETEPETVPTTESIPDFTVPGETYYLGDADMNGIVNVKDATLIQKVTSGAETLTSNIAKLAADADLNADINVKDATVIQKYIAGTPISTPVGKLQTV